MKPIEIKFADPKTGIPYGISPSPHVGPFADMRGIDTQSRPGVARVNFAALNKKPIQTSTTATFNSTTDIMTTVASFAYNQFAPGMLPVYITTSGTLPGGLASKGAYSGATAYSPGDTVSYNNLLYRCNVATTGHAPTTAGYWGVAAYYLIPQTVTTYKLATSAYNANAGTAIDITSNGTGTITVTPMKMYKPNYCVYQPYTTSGVYNYFIQDSIGQIWNTDGMLWTLIQGNHCDYTGSDYSAYSMGGTNLAGGNGLVVFNNYLIVFRGNKLDVYGDITSSPTWTLDWQNMFGGPGNTVDHIPYYNPTQGFIYWYEQTSTYGTGLGSLSQVVGKTFNPSDGTTYSIQSSGTWALQFPTYINPTSLCLVNNNLAIATDSNVIYLWDTVSVYANQQIETPENSVSTMTNVGNFLYFSAGQRGNIYMYNGYTTQKVGQIPPYITKIPNNQVTLYNMIRHNDRIYFGVKGVNCSGIWSYNPNTNVVVFENKISSVTYLSTSTLTFGFLYSFGVDYLMFGYYDYYNGVYGLDGTYGYNSGNTSYFYDSGTTTSSGTAPYFETQMMSVGTQLEPMTFQGIEIDMVSALGGGQSITIYERPSVDASYTLVGTFDNSTYGTATNYRLPFNKSYQNVQFKIFINGNYDYTATPNLETLILYPNE